jgi:hypothetical protein
MCVCRRPWRGASCFGVSLQSSGSSMSRPMGHWRQKSTSDGKICLFFGFLCFLGFLVEIARFGKRLVYFVDFLHPGAHIVGGVVFDPKKCYCCERWGSPPRFLSTTTTTTTRPRHSRASATGRAHHSALGRPIAGKIRSTGSKSTTRPFQSTINFSIPLPYRS